MTSTDDRTTGPTTSRTSGPRTSRVTPSTTSRTTGRATWDATWLTANVRPAGSFGRGDVGRLQALLDVLSASASLVVLDLQATTLRSGRAAEAIDVAAAELERRGGCLLCINADDDARRRLGACRHAVVVAAGEPVPVG